MPRRAVYHLDLRLGEEHAVRVGIKAVELLITNELPL